MSSKRVGFFFFFSKDSRGWKLSKVDFSESLLILPNHCFCPPPLPLFTKLQTHAHSLYAKEFRGGKRERGSPILKSDASGGFPLHAVLINPAHWDYGFLPEPGNLRNAVLERNKLTDRAMTYQR